MTYDFRSRTASKKPLYGHVSPETAYVIDDYPSGFKARCRKRVWLEYKPKQGWRLVEQTSEAWYPGSEPEKSATLRWNKPKASTYVPIAAAMYLDEQDHVQWKGIGGYTKPADVMDFMEEFPKASFDGIKALAAAQVKYQAGKLKGLVVPTINGEPKPFSDSELGETRKELEAWAGVGEKAGLKFTGELKDLIDGKIEATKVDPTAVKQRMQLEREEAEAARAEEAKNTPGAMSYNGFIKYLESLVKLDGRVLSVRNPGSWGFEMVFVNFYNLPRADVDAGRGGGAEAENNRQGYVIDGFDKKDADKEVAKVKVELKVNHVGENSREGHAKTNLRAKSGPPAKIAEYLAAHINKLVREVEPKFTHKR